MYKDKIKTSRKMRNQTLQLIIETLNNKYEKEQVHTERVSKICICIGLALNMYEKEVKMLETVGYLHDIGKIMVNDGYKWVVDIDISKFFNTVNHDKLMAILARDIADKKVLRLIRKYLQSGVMIDGVVADTELGCPQGGPLSPFQVRVHPKAIEKLKKSIKEVTSRSNGKSLEWRFLKLKQKLQGWINYFRIANMKTLSKELDQWLRRRIRLCIWKQWKRVRTRFAELKKRGLSKEKAWEFANTRESYWRISSSPIMSVVYKDKDLENLGLISITKYYLPPTRLF
jgi:hypothetical protein